MMKTLKINRIVLMIGLSVFVLVLAMAGDAHASQAPSTLSSGTNFSSIASNMSGSIAELPRLLSGVAYLFGLLLAVLGVMKIKDHVENPGQTPLKDGAIRLAAGGGLFAIPIISTAMSNTIGTSAAVSQASLNTLSW